MKVIIKLEVLVTLNMNMTRLCMTAQPIKGLGSETIPACYAIANQRLGNDAIPTCSAVKTHPIKEPAKAKKG